jgi:glycosyltransferase involved in cell wall biosynthesis
MIEYPLVSIITPVYNQANYIGETIESVLSQDYENLEYIVIDDGSTDNTVEILKKYSDRIHWETRENKGETATVNEGVSKAKGEIIGIVSSDDPLLPGAIKEIVKVFVEQPDLIIVYPDWLMIDAEGKVIEKIVTFDYNYANMLRWHHCMPGPGTLIKKSVFQTLGGRDPQFRFVADFDFWLCAGLIGPFARIPKTLASYRWYAGGASSASKGKTMAEEHIRLVNKIYSLPNLPKNLLRLKNEAYSSANYIAGAVCGDNQPLRRKYYLAAIKYAPFKYLGEYRKRNTEIFQAFYTPKSCRKMIKRVINRLRKHEAK